MNGFYSSAVLLLVLVLVQSRHSPPTASRGPVSRVTRSSTAGRVLGSSSSLSSSSERNLGFSRVSSAERSSVILHHR